MMLTTRVFLYLPPVLLSTFFTHARHRKQLFKGQHMGPGSCKEIKRHHTILQLATTSHPDSGRSHNMDSSGSSAQSIPDSGPLLTTSRLPGLPVGTTQMPAGLWIALPQLQNWAQRPEELPLYWLGSSWLGFWLGSQGWEIRLPPLELEYAEGTQNRVPWDCFHPQAQTSPRNPTGICISVALLLASNSSPFFPPSLSRCWVPGGSQENLQKILKLENVGFSFCGKRRWSAWDQNILHI